MSLLLWATRAATVGNVLLLGVLGTVWLRNYRRHGASHTLGLLIVAAFLLVENLLWGYFYVFHAGYIGWFEAAGADVQVGMTLLCGLELVALLALARITVR
jgi:hypothetical protein